MSIAASRVIDEVFPRHDIGIYCPVCKKECIFEWMVFRKGERSISQRCLLHGYLRLAQMVPAYIERVKGESLLQFMNDDIPIQCRGCSRQGSVNWWSRDLRIYVGMGSARSPEHH